jgi:hypothetical protein
VRRRARPHVLVLLVIACVVAPVAAAEGPRPAVLVTFVVDQLAAWIADERLPTLPATGGFARLRREGTWVHALVYPYAASDTAPGHAALFTGAAPRQSGIFGNETIEDDTRTRVSILRDPATQVIASDGRRDLPSSSLRVLAVPTLADAVRAARPDATIVSLSLKDRAALFGGGRAPTAVLWFDAGLGRFVTSSAFASSFPAWALPVVGRDFLRAERNRVWTPLDASFVASHAATADAQPGEGDLDGLGVAFPHALAEASDPARAFRATPFGDELLLRLGLAAVRARAPAQPMLLAISLSSNDYIGHVWGPDSWEAWDELVRLDQQLGRFFASLDEVVGPDGWVALLSGDHGITTMPEAAATARPWCQRPQPDRYERSCATPGRIILDELAEELRPVARAAVGDGDWIAGIADPYVYVTPAARALSPTTRQRLDDALAAYLRKRQGVAGVWDARHPPARCSQRDDVPTRVCRSLVAGAPGELYVALTPGWFFDPDYVVGKGTSHGSPYRYDRTVPLLVRAPSLVRAGRVVEEPVDPASYARTAAHLLDVTPPTGARNGRDLAR